MYAYNMWVQAEPRLVYSSFTVNRNSTFYRNLSSNKAFHSKNAIKFFPRYSPLKFETFFTCYFFRNNFSFVSSKYFEYLQPPMYFHVNFMFFFETVSLLRSNCTLRFFLSKIKLIVFWFDYKYWITTTQTWFISETSFVHLEKYLNLNRF